jgi:hypothetical protein
VDATRVAEVHAADATMVAEAHAADATAVAAHQRLALVPAEHHKLALFARRFGFQTL